MTVIEINSFAEYKSIQDKNSKFAVFFWATWHALSQKDGQLHEIFNALSMKYSQISFYSVEVEQVPEISESLDLSVVPSFLTFVGVNNISKLEGADPSGLNKLIKSLNDLDLELINYNATSVLNDKLSKLVNTASVMVFVKGTLASPKCGFSRQIMDILKKHEIPFASFDILSDDEVRQGLKVFSDWPTYPQLYVHGKLIGGLDIVKEIDSSGEDFKAELGVNDLVLPPSPPSLNDRIKTLIQSAHVILFMKGTPDSPQCGFSRTIVQMLSDENIEFAHFNIFSDEEIRQGLKVYSDWPTYPQLYVNGKLIGGLDIVKEMKLEGSLKEQLGL